MVFSYDRKTNKNQLYNIQCIKLNILLFSNYAKKKKKAVLRPIDLMLFFSQTRGKAQMIKVKKPHFSPNKRTVRAMHIIRKAQL